MSKKLIRIATRNGVPAYEDAPPRQSAPVTMADWLNRPREPSFLEKILRRA